MLLPTHIAGAYLTTLSALRASSASDERTPHVQRGPLLYGIVAGVVSDLDILPFMVRFGLSAFGDRFGEHRATFLHTPVCALMLGLAPLLFRIRPRRPWMIAGAVGVLTHLLLDSLTIGLGVMWLYPFSHDFYGLNIATRRYRQVWGDEWLFHYVQHPLFLIELAIIIAALVVSWKRRHGVGEAK